MRDTSLNTLGEITRAVVAIGNEFPAGQEFPTHSHQRAQLLHATRGVVTVTTEFGAWVVPPERAMWIPADTTHSARMHGPVSMRSAYIVPDAALNLPRTCNVIGVSSLLRALLEAAVDLPLDYSREGREARMMALIIDEIQTAPILRLSTPMPGDKRLVAICKELLARPGERTSIDAMAEKAGMSRSSFTRSFRMQTGMSFNKWLQQARLQEAVRLIGEGNRITQVALECGYESSSAFTSTFHKLMGCSPRTYFSDRAR